MTSKMPVLQSSVSLIGLPGSGKTTVGRQLARRLGVPFVDADQVIEERLGMAIRTYFELEGETAFRDIEEQVIDEITQHRPTQVLSTGGGSVVRGVNRAVLRQRSQVFYLKAYPDDLFRRLRHDSTRPLLQVDDPLAKMRELFASRDPLYMEAAHFVVETGRPSVATLINRILMQMELTPNCIG